MGEGELAHLRSGRLDQFFVAVTKRSAPQPGHALDIGFAIGIVDIDALAALDNERAAVAKTREIDIGMHQRFDVAGGEIAERRHQRPLLRTKHFQNPIPPTDQVRGQALWDYARYCAILWWP